ncbi:eukaryotic phosphomannomutase [Roridomyces roridus]|uniref:Phosphomannomutase n=1 Tax=Roridomyces roridus TaxID=1738132 RepID=A0AAD7FR63_9AGAR|nr:eukaryotic phosphomannomutase [Roridomyces roridus]
MSLRPTTCIRLFDIDGTLTPPRRQASQNLLHSLSLLRQHSFIGVIGGSTLSKIRWQLGDDVLDKFDFVFSECGLTAFRDGQRLGQNETFIRFLGEEKYKTLVNFILHYIADLDIPIKRGTFVEFRDGLINICPQGHDTTSEEQARFEEYDRIHHVRQTMIAALKTQFPTYNLVCAIGGRTSFDMFPRGWDKTYSLRYLTDFERIVYFGDKFQPGGNDYEMFHCERVEAVEVDGPERTAMFVQDLLSTFE